MASLRNVQERVEDPGEVRGQRQKAVLVSLGWMGAPHFHSLLSHNMIRWFDDFNSLAWTFSENNNHISAIFHYRKGGNSFLSIQEMINFISRWNNPIMGGFL